MALLCRVDCLRCWLITHIEQFNREILSVDASGGRLAVARVLVAPDIPRLSGCTFEVVTECNRTVPLCVYRTEFGRRSSVLSHTELPLTDQEWNLFFCTQCPALFLPGAPGDQLGFRFARRKVNSSLDTTTGRRQDRFSTDTFRTASHEDSPSSAVDCRVAYGNFVRCTLVLDSSSCRNAGRWVRVKQLAL